jgi:hypothetical protein
MVSHSPLLFNRTLSVWAGPTLPFEQTVGKHLMFLLELFVNARRWWFMPVILATQKAEIRRIMVQSQPEQIVPETLS